MAIWTLIAAVKGETSLSRIICAGLLVVAHAALYASVTAITLWIIHILISDTNAQTAYWLALAALVIPVLRFALLSRQLALSYDLAFDVGERLRRRLIAHLRRLPLGTIRSFKTGRLIGLFNDDIKWIEAFVGGGAALAIGAFAVPLFLLCGIVVVDSQAALILALGMVIGLPSIYLYNRVMAKSVANRARNIANLSSRIGEHFAGMQVVRAFNAVGEKDKSFRHDLETLVAAYRRSAWTMTPLSVVGLFVMEAAIAAVAYYGLSGENTEIASAPIVIFVLFAALSLYNPLLLFLAGSGQYRLAETASGHIQAFLSVPPLDVRDVAAPPSGKPDPAHEPDLAFANVSFAYTDSTVVVQDITFTAQAGELTAIVGPSGAGKTTLFNLAARFWAPSGGAITIGGRDIRDIPETDLCKQISIVTQETVLISDTLRRNIDLGLPHYSDEQVRAAVAAAQCDAFIAQMPDGLDSDIGEAGVRLSGGQKQRLTIARALLRDAPIILLDEAMSSIDPINARLIQSSIAELTHRKTVVVIAHRLSTITGADKIIVMDAGRIIAEGTHETLQQTCALYAKLCRDHDETRHWKL